MNNNHKIHQIGNWEFDQETAILSNKNKQQSLPRLLADLLVFFIHHRDRVVTREELIEELWKDKYVNENALSRAIAELRKALQDSASQPQFIKTLPKKGYQFIHPVVDLHKQRQQQNKKRINTMLLITLITAALILLYFLSNQSSVVTQLTVALNKAQRITARQGMEQQPQLSADGSKITYHNELKGKSHAVIYDIERQKTLDDISAQEFTLYSAMLSHQGDRIIMAAQNAEAEPQCKLLIKNLITKEQQWLGQCSVKNDSQLLTWSKDDSSIIYTDTEAKFGTTALWQLTLATSEKQQLTFPDSIDFFDNTPQISPNGQYLSFSRGNQQVRNLYVKDLKKPTQPLIALTQSHHYSVSHTWIDNQHIIMDSDQTGERLLWLLNINDKIPQLLGARGAQFPSIDINRKKLAFQVAQYEANIWLVDLTSQQQTRLIHSTKYDNNPSFSPSGERFAFSTNRQNHGVIWLYDFNTNEEIKLFELTDSKLTRPSWSTDGEKILVTANNAEGLWSYEFNLSNNQYRKLNFTQENFAAIYIRDDIYAMSKPVNGESTILKLDTADQMTNLNINGISRFMANNNQTLIMSKTNKDGLYLVDLDNMNQKILIGDFPSSALNHWTSSGSYVFYRDRQQKDPNNPYVTKRINTLTHEVSTVSSAYANSVGPSMSVDHTLNRLLLTKTDRAESDLFITDLNID